MPVDTSDVPLTSPPASAHSPLTDWQAAGLNIPSAAKAQLATVESRLVRKVVGRISARDRAAQPRGMRWGFFPTAVAGIVTALVLGVRAAHDRPDLSVSSAHVRRSGLTSTVQVTVKNRSKNTLCPTIQIAARNRDGLDLDKVKAWMAKGAQPSDRVARFLDATGVKKRAARNNPEKAVPRQERKAAAGTTAKAEALEGPPCNHLTGSPGSAPPRACRARRRRGRSARGG